MAFGKEAIEVGHGAALLPHTAEVFNAYKESERRKIDRPRPKMIVKASREQSVFIYSVGCFPVTISAASYGQFPMPYLPIDRVLKGDRAVAGPLPIEGAPSEPYPGESRNTYIDHEPEQNSPFAEHPGLHFALTLIGQAPDSRTDREVAGEYGLFVSEQIEQTKPEEPAQPPESAGVRALVAYERAVEEYEDRLKSYEAWCAAVDKACANFRSHWGRRCDEAHQMYLKGQWEREERVYVVASQILHKTEIECAFLRNTEEGSAKKACISCGKILPGNALKCSSCGELQVPEADFKKEMARRRSSV